MRVRVSRSASSGAVRGKSAVRNARTPRKALHSGSEILYVQVGVDRRGHLDRGVPQDLLHLDEGHACAGARGRGGVPQAEHVEMWHSARDCHGCAGGDARDMTGARAYFLSA